MSRIIAKLSIVAAVVVGLWFAPSAARAQEKAAPARPTNLRTSELAATSVLLTWDDNSSNEDHFNVARLDPGEDPDNPDHWDRIVQTDPNVTSYRATGLQPSSTYSFKVRANNGAEYSNYSNVVQVTTTSGLPGAPFGLQASAVTATTLTLTWVDNSGVETGFNISRLDEGEDPNNPGLWDQIGQVAAGVTTFGVTGLTHNTNYQFRVRAYNAFGYSDYSNIVQAKTLSLLPAAPTGLTITNLASGSLTLQWTDNAANETGYNVARLDQGEDPNSDADWDQINQTGANATTLGVGGLTPDRDYSFRIRAYNAYGYSGYSNIASAHTPPSPPAAPTNLRASDIHTTNLILYWDDNSNNEGGFNISRLDPGEDPGNPNHWDQVAQTVANDFGERIEGLQPGATYQFRVRAFNVVGYSDYSNYLQVQMPDGTPAAPSDLSANDIHMNHFILHWQDNSNDEDSFNVSQLDPGEDPANPAHWDKVAETVANDNGIRIYNLQPLQRYLFRVRAHNEYGYSAHSDTFAVRTIGPTNLNVYFDENNSIDTIPWSAGFAAGYRVRLVAEGLNGIKGWEAKLPLPAGLEFDVLDWQLLRPGTVVDRGVSPQAPWWRVDFDACEHPDAEGKIPLVEFRIVASTRPLLDTRLTPTACSPSSVEPAAPAFDDCAGQPRPFDAINRGTMNPSIPACVVTPWDMDFGVVALGQTATRSLTITNQDDNRVLEGVVRIVDGDNYFTVQGDSVYSLAPGQSRAFTLAYQPQSLPVSITGAHHAEVSVHDEPWHCEDLRLRGASGERLVLALDPEFRRRIQLEDYYGVPLPVWVGLAGAQSAGGWAASIAYSPHLQVTSFESLIPVAPGTTVSATDWDVRFLQCQTVPVGGVLPLARMTIFAAAEFADCHAIVARGPEGLGYPQWRTCPDGPLTPCEYMEDIALGCTDGSGGANKPVAAPAGYPPAGIVPLGVDFAANAYDTDGPRSELRYYWMFGDGAFSTSENPAHAYVDPGTYVVWLNVFDGVADVSEAVNIVVNPNYIAGAPVIPAAVALHRPFPNPFNPRIAIGFALPAEMPVRLDVHDAGGRRVRTMVAESMPAGEHSVIWEGDDESGTPAPAGVYLVRLQTAEGSEMQKVVLLR